MIDTVNLLGCIHLHCEWIIHSKSNTALPDCYHRDKKAYKTECYVCNGTYKKWMLPIIFDGTKAFLASSHFAKCLCQNPLIYNNTEGVVLSL